MKLAGKSEYGRLMVNEFLSDVSWCRIVTTRKSLSCIEKGREKNEEKVLAFSSNIEYALHLLPFNGVQYT